ncbi:MAG TPA: hypothetical protein VMF06_02705 [Candidatus Limnocylindria bacterium]|nr:hypothetical protein [Candidatus Limnocylindria bacterium]
MFRRWPIAWLLLVVRCSFSVSAALSYSLKTLNPQVGHAVEWSIGGVPAVANPFDPEQISVDAIVTTPSGAQKTIPCFWYQSYSRSLSGGNENLTKLGAAEWRGRFTSLEVGGHKISVQVRTNGVLFGSITNALPIAGPSAGQPSPSGFVRVASSNQYFETDDGQPLPLIGANICWPGGRGTYDYDDWFKDLSAHGGNFARLWMCPWAFGIEAEPGTLTKYRLDRAWQLDYVFDLAGKYGIKLMLCLDYHGMYAVTPDAIFGGGDNWKNNPYNSALGGPTSSANGYFTNAQAHVIYEKRLRYLIARYGSSTSLLAWELLNEIDNVYATLNATDVASWHAYESKWIKANDPYNHLVTTSLTGNSDRAEIWNIRTLDFSQYHSYGEPTPAARLTAVTTDQRRRYGKPSLVGEFGINAAGWSKPSDPYLRGLRQALWGGALGGTSGTAMSWWWENLHSEGDYAIHGALHSILAPTHWGQGTWESMTFQTSGTAPTDVSSSGGNGETFGVTLSLNGQWGAKSGGVLALPFPDAANRSSSVFNAFVHGSSHADLKNPFKVNAWYGTNAHITAHVNSVSTGAILAVYVDGTQKLRLSLPDKDGKFDATANEYNLDVVTNLPAGKHLVEIRNVGLDWLYLDWVRFDGVLPSDYAGGWRPSPQAIGLTGVSESLLYVVSPSAAFPANATNPAPPRQTNQRVTLQRGIPGNYAARWYDPESGIVAGESEGTVTNGLLTLPVPDYAVDLVGWVQQKPRLTALGYAQDNPALGMRITGLPGARWLLQESFNLRDWNVAFSNTPVVLDESGRADIAIPAPESNSSWRAIWP